CVGTRSPRRERWVSPRGCFFTVETKRQTLGASASLDELGELQRPDREAKVLERSRQLGSPLVQDDRSTDHDGVATERHGLGRRNFDKGSDPVMEHRAAIVVESAWIVNGHVVRERAEACVEMVEPRVDELEREHLDAQVFPDPEMAADIASEAIAREQGL